MNRENRGFTLVELIVTVAIIAIFSGVVLSVIGTGANSYRKTSSTAKAQMETQEIMDQIQDTIIDVNRSVYYSYRDETDNEISDDIDFGADLQSKAFFACSASEKDIEKGEYSYSCDEIEWDSEEQKLYYTCWGWDGVETEITDDNGNQNDQKLSDDTGEISTLSEDEEKTENFEMEAFVTSKRTSSIEPKVERTLLAENITDFRVDVSKAASNRIVRFQFTTNQNGKEITTLHTVNLRNQVQIQKPESGYVPSGSEKAAIIITHYPHEVKAGKSVSGFDKMLTGNIDPSTVKWIVESGSGTFKESDGTDLSLEAAANSSGTIVIHVEAKTTNGQIVKSSSVTIQIIAVVPNELVTDTKELVIAVGGSYSLSGLISWRIEYSDGTQSEKKVAQTQLIYQKEANSSIIGAGMSLDESGYLIVPAGLGNNESDSVFTLTVKYYDEKTDKTVNGEVTLKLARLDISKPAGTLYVGDTMPFEYTYKEGGVIVRDATPTVSYTKRPRETSTGKVNNVLTKGDIGDWKIRAEVKLSTLHSKDCDGITSAETSFTVKEKMEDGTIDIGTEGADTVVAGAKYFCSYYNSQGFKMNVDNFNWNYKIVWSLEGATDSYFIDDNNITIGDKNAQLYIGENERGFVLSGIMTIYSGSGQNENEIERQYKAKRNVKVITDMEISGISSPAIVGDTYDLVAKVTVWSINDAGQHVSEKKEIPTKDASWKLQTSDLEDQSHTIDSGVWNIQKGQLSGNLVVNVWYTSGVLMGNKMDSDSEHVRLTKIEWIDVEEPAE